MSSVPGAAPGARVLMLATRFYPCQVIGAHRPSRFCKYLPEFGYRPTVVTADPYRAGWPIDEQLRRHLPPSLEVIYAFYPFSHRLRNWAGRLRRPPVVPTGDPAAAARPAPVYPGENRVSVWVGVPDKDVYWAPWVLAAARRPARAADVIYATGPPASTLLMAAWLKRLVQRPLVLDLRDPWRLNEQRIRMYRDTTPLHRWLDARLERFAFRTADAIVCNTQPVCEAYRRHYPDLPPERFCVITNGYDPDDVPALPAARRPDGKVRLGYFGVVYAGRDPGPLLRAARRLIERGRIPPAGVEFVFYGPSGSLLAKIADAAGAADLAVIRPTVPHSEALAQMAACDVLLILGSPETDRMHIPAKTFEYLPLRKPILALAGPGALGDLMQQHRFGCRAAPDDAAQVERVLEDLVTDVRAGRVDRYLAADPSRLTRRALTRDLAAVFDRVRGLAGAAPPGDTARRRPGTRGARVAAQ